MQESRGWAEKGKREKSIDEWIVELVRKEVKVDSWKEYRKWRED